MGQRRLWTILIVSLLLIGCAYYRVLGNGFISFDDPDYVTDNGFVRQGFTPEALAWAFTSIDYCNWHPLTWLSHMLDVRLYWLSPAGHHLTNLLFHWANTVLLATFLLRITGAFRRSLAVALLFALHPLHVESVAWVAERKDVLSAFFWFLTLHAYVSYARRPAAGRYLLVLGCFLLGLMAKPMVVTLPLVLLLLDFWPLERFRPGTGGETSISPWRLAAEKLPLLLLSAASSVITFVAQKGGGAVAPLDTSLPANAGNALVSYAVYLEKMVWPLRLAFLYPFDVHGLTPWRLAGTALFLAAVSLLVVLIGKNRRYLVTGWLWYLVTLLPVIGLVRVGPQAMADRYTYLPLTGVFIMVVWGAAELAAGSRRRERLAAGAGVAVLLVLFLLTWRQTAYWRDSLTLYNHALAVTEDNWLAHNNLGTEYLMHGDVERAVWHYQEAIRINPRFDRAHNNMGRLYLGRDMLPEALEEFKKAVECNPRFATARLNLGHTWLQLGRRDLALEQYEALRAINPKVAAALLQSIDAAGGRPGQ